MSSSELRSSSIVISITLTTEIHIMAKIGILGVTRATAKVELFANQHTTPLWIDTRAI